MRLLNKKKGFTLIELLVVIAIIGILATIVLVSLNTARAKARDARRSSDMHQFALAMEMAYDSHNSAYPGNLSGVPSGTIMTPYMPILPSDPLAAQSYTWYSDGTTGVWDATGYCVFAHKEQPNTVYVLSNGQGTKEVTAADVATPGCMTK